jgi:hypothetical protein
MLLHEVLAQTELDMKQGRSVREQEMGKLARIATRNRPSAAGRAWASATTGLGRLAERGSDAVRSALTGPPEPDEQCC